MALPRPGTLLTLPEKNPQRMEVGEPLTTRLIQEPNQDTGGGQRIPVGPVAIPNVDSVVPGNRVEIPAAKAGEKSTGHLDRAQAFAAGHVADGLGKLPTHLAPVEACVVCDKNPALESVEHIGRDLVEEGRGRDHTIVDTGEHFDAVPDGPPRIHERPIFVFHDTATHFIDGDLGHSVPAPVRTTRRLDIDDGVAQISERGSRARAGHRPHAFSIDQKP